jgi:large subunit ribosomal protein L23
MQLIHFLEEINNMPLIFVQPVITEASMNAAKLGKYTFRVGREATKQDIKSLVAKRFGVHVVGISTSTIKGKRKRVGTRRQEVNGSVYKKAIVKLKSGEKIDMFDAGGQE